ncbi:GspH/FimT family pseudopilin [Pelagibaculum spongiae]|uniref:GspH/FimT family pseudopilin n=1 Tax=Pelagibaculum spongiae TaxID=2080658 RepID=UPI0019D4A4DF|nr:GspH/FimT family pseudopilin [Pelagibaculum spongiae]
MQKYKKGFTLVELMITMALLAILATVAIPSFQNSIYRKHSETAGYEMASLVRLARSEALVRASEVRICDVAKLTTDNECPDDGNSWNGDVAVVAKKQGAATFETLAVVQGLSVINATSTNLGDTIILDLQGRTKTRAFKLCDKKNIACRDFTITPRGRTHVEKHVVATTP